MVERKALFGQMVQRREQYQQELEALRTITPKVRLSETKSSAACIACELDCPELLALL